MYVHVFRRGKAEKRFSDSPCRKKKKKKKRTILRTVCRYCPDAFMCFSEKEKKKKKKEDRMPSYAGRIPGPPPPTYPEF